MIGLEHARVMKERDSWPGVQRVWVARGDSEDASDLVSALSYTELFGPLTAGDQVTINCNALNRGLGTGGDAFVVDVRTADGSLTTYARSAQAPDGHMMKLRYTPLQTMVDAVDDPSSPHHSSIDQAESLEEMPVVVADLHSSLAPIVAGIHATSPGATIVYIHPDWAALPVAYSRAVGTLRSAGLVANVVSCGQSFGGDVEAVSLPSALMAARHVLGADVAIVAQGPGNLGSGTTWGYSGIHVADALNTVAALGGRPIHALRVSGADLRERHRGLSHHSATVLERLALASVVTPIPRDGTANVDAHVAGALTDIATGRKDRGLPTHDVVRVSSTGLHTAVQSLPLRVRTMGRGLDDDWPAFHYAALAGRAALSP